MSEKDTTASSAPKGAPSPMELVLQFHRTYSMPIQPFTSPTLDYERLGMRMSLIAEEFAELMGAVYGPRARAIIEEATAQAVASDEGERDVIDGMAIESGMDLDSVLAEVQASNLSKLMPDGSVKLREDGKVLKGPNFFQPNIARGLGLEEPEDTANAD